MSLKKYIPYRRWTEAVSRIVEWIPVLWRDVDWDYWGMWHVLDYKLSRMERVLRDDPHGTHSKKYARQIHVCRLLIQRLKADNYAERMWDEYRELYPVRWIRSKDGDGSTLDTGPRSELRSKRIKWAMAHEELQRKQDEALLFKKIRAHYGHWWT